MVLLATCKRCGEKVEEEEWCPECQACHACCTCEKKEE